jgi:hypothetical protein
VINAVHHADGSCGDEIAAAGAQLRALHRGVRQAHGQQRFQLDASRADHGLQQGHGVGVGDTRIAVEATVHTGGGQLRLDLRAAAVNQHQAHAEAGQQGDVLGQGEEVGGLGTFAGHGQHEGRAAVQVDVRRRIAEPADRRRVWLVHGVSQTRRAACRRR